MTLTHSGASELSKLMEGTTAGALIPEIVRRGFQDLLEASAQPSPKELCPPSPAPSSTSAVPNSDQHTATGTASGCSPLRCVLTLAIPRLR
jgi:hypothetical protein